MILEIFDQSIGGETKNSIEVELNTTTTPREIITARVSKEVSDYNARAHVVFKRA